MLKLWLKQIQWEEKKKRHTCLVLLLIYFILYTCIQFLSKKFFKAFTCSKQNNYKNIFKTARHFQVISVCLFVFFVNSPCYTFFNAFTLLIWSNLANIFKTTHHVEQNIENKFPVTASMFLYSDRSWAYNQSQRSLHWLQSLYIKQN